MVSLAELTAAAVVNTGPMAVSATTPRLGGVDPLGLRQINFDLMDQVLPDLNNVARLVRPFTVTSWAWRRAAQLAEERGSKKVSVESGLRDFVDRIEVLYSWSQFLRDRETELPGRQVMQPLLREESYRFGGGPWKKRREARRDSTAFSAAVNYGPTLKSFGWLSPHLEDAGVMIASEEAQLALDAFEKKLEPFLHHPAFSSLGVVEVDREDVERWAQAWAIDTPTAAERKFIREALVGDRAPPVRRQGIEFMRAVARQIGSVEADEVREAMSRQASRLGLSRDFDDTSTAWRRVQVRQVFRLALEALFSWLIRQLGQGPRSTEQLVARLVEQANGSADGKASTWLQEFVPGSRSPVRMLNKVTQTLQEGDDGKLVPAVIEALAYCLREAPARGQPFESRERLPLFRARHEAESRAEGSIADFVRHILEAWVLAQHVYWSVGRGLADARSRGKTILRLKVVMEEGGWTLAPGVSSDPSIPRATPDRLETALSLCHECGLL